MADSPLLQVQDLVKHFPIRKGLVSRTVGAVRAVDGVSFTLNRGETLGVVGESGCGKTTVGRTLLRLIEPDSGKIVLHSADQSQKPVDVAALSQSDLKKIRPRMQMVFQDPQASLNPRMTVQDIITEPMLVNGIGTPAEREHRAAELLQAVGLRAMDSRRYPHAFSGGQRQRIGIARALALQPELIIADEPVSALDVSVQAQVLNLMADLRAQLGLSYIFISHGLGVVEHIADRVAVMYLGRIVETGPTRELFTAPRHPYTEALLSAVPVADPREQRKRERIRLTGDVPSPANPPSGCRFHPRCIYAIPLCKEQEPPLTDVGLGCSTACHRREELKLAGV